MAEVQYVHYGNEDMFTATEYNASLAALLQYLCFLSPWYCLLVIIICEV